MVKTVQAVTGRAYSSSLTHYNSVRGFKEETATEANGTVNQRPAGVYSNLWCRVSANTNNTATTVKVRKNSSDGTIVISIGADTTGEFEDTTHTDTFADGDDFSIQTAFTLNSGATTIDQYAILFDATTNTVTNVGANAASPQTLSSASATRYLHISGNITLSLTTETTAQHEFKSSCTFKKTQIRMTANTRGTATTLRFRKNAGNGNQTVSIGAGVTGILEDTSNTDSIVSGDKVNWSIVTGTGTGNFTINGVYVAIETTTSTMYLDSGINGGQAQTSALTRYYAICVWNALSTEGIAVVKSGVAGTVKNMTVNVPTNSLNGTSTIRFRKNSSDINPVVSVSSSTTGFFSDTTNTSSIVATDLINFSQVTAGSSGSITPANAMVEILTSTTTPVTKTLTTLFHIEKETTKTLTTIFDVRKEVPKSLTLIYNVTKEITPKQLTTRFDILKEVPKTLTIRHNIESQVTKQVTTRFDILKEITKSLTSIFNINIPVEKSVTFLYDIGDFLNAVTKTVTLLHNIESQTTKTNTLKFDINTTVTKPVTTRFDITNEITAKSLTLRFDINKEVTKQATLLFNIHQELTRTLTFIYHVFKEVEKSTTLRYDISKEITKTLNLIHSIEGQITKLTTIRYNIEQSIIKSTSLLFNINQETTKTLTLQYNINQIVTKALNLIYHLLNEIAPKTTTIRYDIFKEVVKINTLLYDIDSSLVTIVKSLTLIHNIVGQTTKTTSIKYDINNIIEKTNTLRYNITKEIIPKSLTLRHDINAEVTKPASFIYNIHNIVSKSLTIIYSIFQEVTKSTTLKHDINQEAVKSVSLKYNILQELTKDTTIVYNILNEIARSYSIIFDIYKEVDKSFTLKYNITSEIKKDNTIIFNISQALQKLTTIRYDIFQEAEKSSTLRYNITSEIARNFTLLYTIYEELTRQTTILYNILNEVEPKTLTIRYDIESQILKLINLKYNIDNIFQKSFTIIYNVLPKSLVQHESMHEQLLDYIYSSYSLENPDKDSERIRWHSWYNGISDINIDSKYIVSVPIPERSNLIYKERNYTCAIHIFYRSYGDNSPNTPIELSKVINEIHDILERSRYNVSNEFKHNVYEMKILNEGFVPEPKQKTSDIKVLHYRYKILMTYQKLITQ